MPKSATPYQWNGMQRREYFEWAHRYLRSKVALRSVRIKCHDIDTSLLEGVLTRGDRRLAPVLMEAWRRGARLDAWREYFQPQLWWDVLRDLNVDVDAITHRHRPVEEVLPWDHILVKKGREYLAKEQNRSVVQLDAMAGVS